MEPVFVKAYLDIDCDWEGLPPAYRVYVNDELFTERGWYWNDAYLREFLQILAKPGLYTIRIEPVLPTLAKFTVLDRGVEIGPGQWTDENTLCIQDQQ